MGRSIGIIIPAYRPDIDRLESYVWSLVDHLGADVVHIELDAATSELTTILSDLPVSVNAVPERRGKGAAITAGFERLDTDVFAFVDADGSTPVGSVLKVIEPIETDAADLSVGSRRHPAGQVEEHQTRVRRRLGDVFAWVARRSIDVSLYDYQCGAKAITAQMWREVRTELITPGFAWDVELIAMVGALDGRVIEVPIVWRDFPRSTVDPIHTCFELGKTLVRTRHRTRCIEGNRFHRFVAAHRRHPPSLVDQVGTNALDSSPHG